VYFFEQALASRGFQPHGFCYAWNTGLVSLHVVSDLLIAAAYLVIPLILLWFLHKRPDVPFSWMFAVFGVFIVACGATHLIEVWNLWHAQYWLAGAVKAVTAAASIGAAIMLSCTVPRLLLVPNLAEWAKANSDLEQRVAQRSRELSLANDESRESRNTLSMAQRAGRIGTFERDLVSGRSAFSPEMEELLGLPPGGANDAAEVLRGLLHPDDRVALEVAGADSLGDGHAHVGEVRAVPPNGASRWLFTRTNVVRDAAGRPLRMVGVSVDITERKQAEEQVQLLNAGLEARVAERTAELSSANQELESFSYSVSHDLRSPLRTIDGFSLALLEDCDEQLDESGKAHLQRIRSAAQRMGMLIDDLLNLSRVSRAQLNVETFDLSAMVNSVAQDLQTMQAGRQVAWRIQPGVSATGDARLLKIVIENLLNNAWKFTSKHPSAFIEFGSVHNAGAGVYFVRDDGAGFDSTYADRLFGAFQRLHGAADFPGTGVGLATVQRVIHRHGGRVWAESAVDRGATFFFTLSKTISQEAHEQT
jgi:PAS domain S-box-containing protein